VEGVEREREELRERLKESEGGYQKEKQGWSEEMLMMENRQNERYERLLREYRMYKEGHEERMTELQEQVRVAQEKAVKMEEEMATGQPQERRILELAELQARREEVVRKAEQEVTALRQTNTECKAQHSPSPASPPSSTVRLTLLSVSLSLFLVSLSLLCRPSSAREFEG
jgi:hypothetical protein